MPRTCVPCSCAAALLRVLVVSLLPWLLAGCGTDPWLQRGWTDPAFLLMGSALPPNFHTLDAGKAYRSGQPVGWELQDAITLFGLKTVLNLHGSEPGSSWYDQEVLTCQQMNVTFVDCPMDPGRLPSPDTLNKVVATLKTASYPMLIHCAAGVDRTGAVSAIYLMLIKGTDKAVALEQLGPSAAPWMHALAQMYHPTDEWLATYPQIYDDLTASVDP